MCKTKQIRVGLVVGLALALFASVPGVRKASAQGDTVIYDDGVSPGWQDWSWGSVERNFDNTSPVKSGSKSISTRYVSGYSGLQLARNDSVNISGATAFKLSVHGNATGANGIWVELANPAGTITKFGPTTIAAGTSWADIVVPLPAGTSSVNQIKIYDSTGVAGSTLYFDDLAFVGASSGSSGGGANAIFDDVLNTGWEDWSWGATQRDFANTAPIQAGSKSLRVKFDSGYSGLQLGNTSGVSLNGVGRLSFFAKGGGQGDNLLKVHLASGGSEFVQAGPFALPSNADWTEISVPIPSGSAQLTALKIFDQTGGPAGQFYIDTIRLGLNASAGPLTWTKTEVIAHRGDRVSSPENTAMSVSRAIEKQARYIEIDVQLGSDNRVVVAHGSRYRDGNAGRFGQTEVYGPTTSCHDKNLESDPLQPLLDACDIGTRMRIEVGDSFDSLGSRNVPKFKNERYQLLADLFARHSDYCGWMIELKASSLSNAAARNGTLGTRVQELMQSSGLLDRCGELWVTSFEDSALETVTDPRIKKMRQISVNPFAIWKGEADVALQKGYQALNIEFSATDDNVTDNGVTQKVPDYLRSRGLRISAYTLGAGGGQQQSDNQVAIDRKLDFFMTDILDDLLVRNGSRSPAHKAQTIDFNPNTDRLFVRNDEAFEIFVALANIGSIKVPAFGWLTVRRSTSGQIVAEVIAPTYAANWDGTGAGITYATSAPPFLGTLSLLQNGGPVAITAQHPVADNVEPRFVVSVDRLAFGVNALKFPTPDGKNPAVVGNECAEAAPNALAKKINMVTTMSSIVATDKPTYSNVTDNRWTIENLQVILDDQPLGANTASGYAVSAPAGGVVKDLTIGEHTFRVTYTAVDAESPELKRFEVWAGKFTVKLKPCLANKDIALVFDSSGSIGQPNFDGPMKTFGTRFANGLDVGPATANIGVINFSSSVQTVLPLSNNRPAIVGAVNGMSYFGGGTSIGASINQAQSVLAAGRPDAPNVIVILTDGESSDNVSGPVAAAKSQGTTIIAVGIGDGISGQTLQTIASNPGYVFTPGDFDDLIQVVLALLPANP
jgi:glycerophosphoryl diester phosphodiesterase